ncbi:hypothetical protein CF328_g6843 [Tilletia controversa]|nr:hypothetical protein CF328_g6843 [Tilletia controversa]
MQIRRFSHLSFFLPVVLIGSIALAMVAGAPAPASADLEQHNAESFLTIARGDELTTDVLCNGGRKDGRGGPRSAPYSGAPTPADSG